MANDKKDQIIYLDQTIEGKIFQDFDMPHYSGGLPQILGKALEWGDVLTLPEIVAWRIKETENESLRKWFTPLSEEVICRNPNKIGVDSDNVYIVAHGRATVLFSRREYYKEALGQDEYSGSCGIPLDQKMMDLILSGHDGAFPVYKLDEYREAFQSCVPPRDHIVVCTEEQLCKMDSEKIEKEPDYPAKVIENDPFFAMRVGGTFQAQRFLKAEDWTGHPYKSFYNLAFVDHYDLSKLKPIVRRLHIDRTSIGGEIDRGVAISFVSDYPKNYASSFLAVRQR